MSQGLIRLEDPGYLARCRCMIMEGLRSIILHYCANGHVGELKTLLHKLKEKIGLPEVRDFLVEYADEKFKSKLMSSKLNLPFYKTGCKRKSPHKYRLAIIYDIGSVPEMFIHHPKRSTDQRVLRFEKYMERLSDISNLLLEGLEDNMNFKGHIEEQTANCVKIKKSRWTPLFSMGQRCLVQSTPLIVAVWEGQLEICKMLITEFEVDLNHKGHSSFCHREITPLWVGVYRTELKVVKMLIDSGAEISPKSDVLLTEACHIRNAKMIELLLSYGANMHLKDAKGETSIMFAIRCNSADAVSCLLEFDSKMEGHSERMKDILIVAIKHGNVTVLREVLKYVSDLRHFYESELTPIFTAAMNLQEEVVVYFMELNVYSRQEKIDALELLGSSFAEPARSPLHSVTPNFEKCFFYLRVAFLQRLKQPYLLKPIIMPTAAYQYHIESQTLDQLDRRKDKADELLMEALVVRERILGQNTRTTDPFIISVLREYADSPDHDKCFELLKHCSMLVDNKTLRESTEFCTLANELFRTGKRVPANLMLVTLEYAADELQYILEISDETLDSLLSNSALVDLAGSIVCSIAGSPNLGDEDKNVLATALRKIADRFPGTKEHLLHRLVGYNMDEGMAYQIVGFLAHLGTDLNAVELSTGTILQGIVADSRAPVTENHFKAVVRLLIEHGALADSCFYNELPHVDFFPELEDEKSILAPRTKVKKLQCLAASAILEADIPYDHLKSRRLRYFIGMHQQNSQTFGFVL